MTEGALNAKHDRTNLWSDRLIHLTMMSPLFAFGLASIDASCLIPISSGEQAAGIPTVNKSSASGPRELAGHTPSQSGSVDIEGIWIVRGCPSGLNRERRFPDNDRPVAFGRLKVVGFIQDDSTKEVLVARQVDVPAGREP